MLILILLNRQRQCVRVYECLGTAGLFWDITFHKWPFKCKLKPKIINKNQQETANSTTNATTTITWYSEHSIRFTAYLFLFFFVPYFFLKICLSTSINCQMKMSKISVKCVMNWPLRLRWANLFEFQKIQIWQFFNIRTAQKGGTNDPFLKGSSCPAHYSKLNGKIRLKSSKYKH